MFDYSAGLNKSAVFSLQENMRSGKMMQLKCLRAVAASREGGMGYPVWGSAPHLPPVRKKKWSKSAIFCKFLDFCPLRNALCSLNASHKKFFGAPLLACTVEMVMMSHSFSKRGKVYYHHLMELNKPILPFSQLHHFKMELHPNQKLACFALYLKIVTSF